MVILLSKVPSFHSVHRRPSPDEPFRPMTLVEVIPPWVFQPADDTSVRVALEHEGAVIVTDDKVHPTVSSDIDRYDRNRRIELSDLILLPG